MVHMDGNTVSVERVIKASPAKIFALLADAGQHGNFDGSKTLNHADQTSVPLSMGAKFGRARLMRSHGMRPMGAIEYRPRWKMR